MELLRNFGASFTACGTYIIFASFLGLPNSWEYGLGVLVVGTIMIFIGSRKK
jgi:hypothetical protein